MNKSYKLLKGFTLAEITVAIILLGIIAAIVIPNTYKNVRNKIFVVKAKKIYSSLEKATEVWMTEEGCVDNIAGCLRKYKTSPQAFNEIANRYLALADSSVFDAITVGRACTADELQIPNRCTNGRLSNYMENFNRLNNLDWLPEETIQFNGDPQQHPWQGVSKKGINDRAANLISTGFYLLKDGTTISVQLPDDERQSGFGFFDVNGKKGPNKIGVDTYPFGFGIYCNANTRAKCESLYGNYLRNFNPYFAEDNGWSGNGMCHPRNGTDCPNNKRDNPLVYLLINNKVPNN